MYSAQIEVPARGERRFLPNDLVIDSWLKVEPYFEDLKKRTIGSLTELENWLLDSSELEAVFEEDMAWRYIKMNIDTTDQALMDSFQFFVAEIEPKMAPYADDFNRKLVDSEWLASLDQEKYRIHLRQIKKAIELYREENIPLLTQLQTDSQKFGTIAAKMSVTVDGEELTMQRASKYLRNTSREKREEVFQKMNLRRREDFDNLNELFSHLVGLRDEVAKNAGYDNFRDYKFDAMGRFDYTVQDCHNFHDSIQSEILPIVNGFAMERKAKLELDNLRPWDTEVDISGKPALEPFKDEAELIEKTVTCFHKVRPYFGDCMEIMRQMGHLDLESKAGKAPGGFNYPLYEIGVPFIYMNAVGSFQDVVTMVHEGGHAVHSFLSRNLELTAFKNLTSEVAELASMSMELISMEHWDVFFENEDDLKRARKEQLTKIIGVLPWIALIDKFQHWVYENPKHTTEERTAKWLEMHGQFSNDVVDWTGFEMFREQNWQRQLHLFEVPFYYIEYGMAQLGAIAVWRNYKADPEKALNQYTEALKLGYTKSIGEIYEAAGIKFDFSGEYVHELADFVKSELAKMD